MELEQLMKNYNSKLARYQKMSKWYETASIAEQLALERNIVGVINDCNDALNKITQEVSQQEILYGFEV